jgi:methyl-accepting chemotaxis protein
MGSHWTIARKLGLMTAVLLAILVATSGFGILGMSRMHEGFRSVSQDTTRALIDLTATVDALHRIRIRVVSASVEADPARVAALKAEFDKQVSDLNQAWSIYLSSPMTPEERKLAEEVTAGLESYRGFVEGLWVRLAGGEARNVLKELLGEAGTKKFRQAGTPLRNLLSYQSEEAGSLFSAGEERYVADRAVSLGLVILGAILGMASALTIGRSVSRPVARIVAVMERLARNDTSVEIEGRDRGDEVGAIARAVEVFKRNAIDKARMEREAEESKNRAAEVRRAEMRQLADGFEGSVANVVESVSGASSAMESTASTMSSLAEKVAAQAVAVAEASELAATNVETVAAAAEQLSRSVTEISRQVSESVRVANTAVEEAANTDAIVGGLSSAAEQIGEVVKLINHIASQTNLLALNATIEAARAGDAGKGFAVVANEVKGLATQTAKATDEITQQIGTVQAETGRAAEAIRHVNLTIARINEISAAIAAAVEQQTAATQEIARNVEAAAHGTQAVSKNISEVKTAAKETGSASDSVLGAARKLSEESRALNLLVGDFVAKVRSG